MMRFVRVETTAGLSASSNLLLYGRRRFGNAPTRVRPGEEPPLFQWSQSPRESSAMLIISSMFIVPMWMIVMWEDNAQKKKRATMEWAEAYDSNQDPWKRGVSHQNTPTGGTR
jgi:hypothetical protein